MGSVRSDGAFFRNLGLEGSEGAGTFAFFTYVADCEAQEKLVVVCNGIQGAIVVLFKPFFKDGVFVVGLD